MIKEVIRKRAKELGLEKIGFADGAVVALFPYYVKGESGNISIYARGTDYHCVAEEKLKQLERELKNLGAKKTFVHVDKGGLDDRGAALDAGLGFLGKNGMVICEEFGSYFFIGQVVHDLKLEKEKAIEGSCLSCGACIKACPGGALSEKGFEIEKCLSEITQKKGELEKNEEKLLADNGFCWGCDVCQRVCPHNAGLDTTAMPEFLEKRIIELRPEMLTGLSNKEFREKYGKYAFSWRGKKVLERNLNILFEKEKL